MQRFSSIVMLVVFSFSLIAPAMSTDTEAKLPPCCRRDGKHGCGMKMMKSTPASHGVALHAPSRCSLFGKGTVTPAAERVFVLPPGETVPVALTSHPASLEQAQAGYRISHSRARQKRGPPPFLS